MLCAWTEMRECECERVPFVWTSTTKSPTTTPIIGVMQKLVVWHFNQSDWTPDRMNNIRNIIRLTIRLRFHQNIHTQHHQTETRTTLLCVGMMEKIMSKWFHVYSFSGTASEHSILPESDTYRHIYLHYLQVMGVVDVAETSCVLFQFFCLYAAAGTSMKWCHVSVCVRVTRAPIRRRRVNFHIY